MESYNLTATTFAPLTDSLFCTEQGNCFAETGNSSVGNRELSYRYPIYLLLQIARSNFSVKLSMFIYTIKLRIRRVCSVFFLHRYRAISDIEAEQTHSRVGWATRSVPTTLHPDGGHGAQERAFAHPTVFYGPLDTRYAAIATRSASSSLSTTAFISGVQVPVRVPILMSLS